MHRNAAWTRCNRTRIRHHLLHGVAPFILAAGPLIGVPQKTGLCQDRARVPNIVLIVADDLGYADVGFQGCQDIATPNIDALAKSGVRFTSGYVSCPVCSPTRAGLLTGRYQQRFGHEFNPGRAQQDPSEIGLPLSETTLADALKSAGYATSLVGKWHLGDAPKFHPQRRGFDEFFGFLGGGHSYVELRAEMPAPIYRGAEPVNEPAYLTDALAREAVDFIQRHRDAPFFLYLTFNAVHAPLQATDTYLKRFSAIADERRRTYAAMLSAMDDSVGAVARSLREHGLDEQTLVFFISDNGGPSHVQPSRNTPLSGNKGTVMEGGIRVPFVMSWKGHIAAGSAFDEPVISLDIFATVAAAARVQRTQDCVRDGVDLLPYVTGKARGAPHEFLFWRFGQQYAVRHGRWKLSQLADGPLRLYDLRADIAETQDQSAAEPKVVEELSRAYAEWSAQLATPRWQPARAARRARNRARSAG